MTSLIEAASLLRAWLRDETKEYHEDQLLDLAQDVAAALDDLDAAGPAARRIYFESVVKSRDLEPALFFRWGNESGELTPAEARQHALDVLAAADAAEGDAFLINFLHVRVRAPIANVVQVLKDFRAWREQHEGKPASPPPHA